MSDDSTNNDDNADDNALFRQEMEGVTPLKPSNRVLLTSRPAKTSTNTTGGNDTAALNDAPDDVFSDAEITEECPETLRFSRGGLQHQVLKKLRQGKFPLEHTLDLHGLTVPEARRALQAFLAECDNTGIRHALIVHGKGYRSREKAVIKPMLNRWLRQVDQVLAFHSAQPRDGGTGAVYVLLRKN